MKNDNSKNIIIVKKRRGGHHGHHGGAWKVAYADFVTAMMAFFLVMWLVAQAPETRAAVAGYFRDPGAFEQMRAQGLFDGGASAVAADDGPMSVKVDDTQAALVKAADELRQALERLPEFAEIADRVRIEMTAEGLRIELLESATDGFFQVGSSALKPQSLELLGVIASQLSRLPNPVAIEGHTDARPYHSSEVFSNWELSTDRANAARRVMQQRGLGATQVQAVRGYADVKLRFASNPLDARNRRISILVRPLGAATEVGQVPLASSGDD